jgi:hypothetical protein
MQLAVSGEPMTGPVDLKFCACETCCRGDHPGDCSTCAGWGDHSGDDEEETDALGFASCEDCDGDGTCSLCGGSRRDARIGWVICGGESGQKARPSNLEWFRSLRDQCVAAGVPFFFKQWGEWAPDYYIEDDDPPGTPPRQAAESMSKVGKTAAGRLLDGREWNEVPNV